jgi:hypothetical protein
MKNSRCTLIQDEIQNNVSKTDLFIDKIKVKGTSKMITGACVHIAFFSPL